MMGRGETFRCPVCRAKFRSTRTCSRCGADLSILMKIVAEAHIFRIEAVNAIHSHDFKSAHVLVGRAQKLHETQTGRKLLLLTSWLVK
ncbi:MAG: hypothetical protein B6240_10755 [Desulfobacteraceae bacterium 4572_87]|nr:MAG: hypothetical protein B6240_10755 [Desulfobacteraceae bacterium 4572_87]